MTTDAKLMPLYPSLITPIIAEASISGRPVKFIEASCAQFHAWEDFGLTLTVISRSPNDPGIDAIFKPPETMAGIALTQRWEIPSDQVRFLDGDRVEVGRIVNLAVPAGFERIAGIPV